MDFQNLLQNHFAQMAGSVVVGGIADHTISSWLGARNTNPGYGTGNNMKDEHQQLFDQVKNDFFQKNNIDENSLNDTQKQQVNEGIAGHLTDLLRNEAQSRGLF